MTAIAVTIAGSDSSGGAGIQADLKTFSALGVYGASVVTALTAQNTKGVTGIHDVPASFVREQMDAVFSDLDVTAVKIGMLFNAEIIMGVAQGLEAHDCGAVILDPVMIATSGDPLLVDEAVNAMQEYLFPLVDLITPNLHEAAHLTGLEIAKNDAEMETQATALLKLGVKAVLIKGGHSAGDEARDFYSDGNESFWLSSKLFDTNNTHGTGCTLSSAIAAGLAKGVTMGDALEMAKAYLAEAIANADTLKIGTGHGPVHHFHGSWKD
ncbi:MAG: bifunctional hydroxymethylpyrimidine kinase/phosphomethylpyrimidine kinase [Hyphomicrobiales bacterium]